MAGASVAVSRPMPRSPLAPTIGSLMASAVAAWSGVANSVVLDNPGCVDISYPSFWRDAAALGVDP